MSIRFPSFLRPCIELAFPGPSGGRSGDLRKQILELETRKRDRNLGELFELEAQIPSDSAWIGLGTIGYEIVSHFKPNKIVELGSHAGFSTFAMGLALRDMKTAGKIYAVDTWEVDEHSGFYADEDVYQAFMYKRSALGLEPTVFPLRMTFQQASEQITPPIDLLHVDGVHKFQSVLSDFRAFKHLLAPNALVLFHDVYTFFVGMRVFWALLSRRYPSYTIPYSHGLGIIQVRKRVELAPVSAG
jgi:hypothetical protein